MQHAADRETTPPVALPGMSPTSSDESTPPPEEGRLPLAARTGRPGRVTVTCAPVLASEVCAPAEEISARFITAVTVGKQQ